MRLGLPGLADDDVAQWSAQMSAATTSDQVLALTREHASRRRAAFYRLLQLKDTARAAEVADHPVLSALAHHLGDRPDVRDQALTEAAQDHAPPSSAVRAWHRLRRLNVPQSNPDAFRVGRAHQAQGTNRGAQARRVGTCGRLPAAPCREPRL